MRGRHAWTVGVALLLGCAGTSYFQSGSETLFGQRGARVWVKGPWPAVHPSADVDEVIDQLCPAVMALDRARERDYGQEYCGLIYSLGGGEYYASWPSPLGRTTLVGSDLRRKSCSVPSSVRDDRGLPSTLADFHSHPWFPSGMSQEDRWGQSQRWTLRIQFDAGCTVTKLVPYKGENRPGEVYLRRDKTWKLIGYIHEADKDTGFITPVED
ncbi:hypothetical protein [Corallococcus carmarthensis]|uniref:JAB domain-containing protein n=1 Tax=Corallococcus carmarthensis TaxID=2316728 RepID=A0A3A8JTN4_9BACT|nr:hypothetical protein [Corallococcus carmarthensis]RKG95110.1 hypothetical protein D7X32_40080 [Corallococcus carmarthensis]